jgi:type II secretory pathway predicted ATPase ExeA
MRHPSPEQQLSLASEREENEQVAAAAKAYLRRAGLSQRQFSARIDYSPVSLSFFMCGRYHQVGGSARNIRSAVELFMQQNPLAPPTEVSGELYETANVRLIESTFERLIPKPVALMLYAPPGSQKTFALRNVIARFNLGEMKNGKTGRRAAYVYARQDIRPRDLIKRVAVECNCDANNSIDATLDNLRWDYRSRRVLLIIDEAQHLSLPCLEVVRELIDQPPQFSILLSGSHSLKHTFDRFSSMLEQWNSRIVDKVRLPGLMQDEAEGIIRRELGEIVAARGPKALESLTAHLIKQSTAKDAFEKNRTYINVRTLTNAIDTLKAGLKEDHDG